jgi:4-azaleucine resistance transporter AzlC
VGAESFRRGLRDGFPIMVAVGLVGVGYGVVAVEAGLPPWLTVLSSVLIVSGAAQFALVGLLAAGPGPALVAVTGLGLRHVPMSATLARLVGHQPLLTRLRLAWILVDETFGLTLRAAKKGEHDLVSYKSAADLMLYSGWVAGTALGALVGAAAQADAWGIDVVFGLLFLGLAAPLISDRRHVVVALTAVVATLAAVTWLPASWQIVAAASAASLVGLAGGRSGGDR